MTGHKGMKTTDLTGFLHIYTSKLPHIVVVMSKYTLPTLSIYEQFSHYVYRRREEKIFRFGNARNSQSIYETLSFSLYNVSKSDGCNISFILFTVIQQWLNAINEKEKGMGYTQMIF